MLDLGLQTWMFERNKIMDNSFISRHCANCAITFSRASQIFTTITIVDEATCSKIEEIGILDAVVQIFGFSAMNLATEFLNYSGENDHLFGFNQVVETSEYIVEHGLPLCRSCVSIFKKVYVAVHQLKNLSDETSILTRAIKRFFPKSIKIETDQEEENKLIKGTFEGEDSISATEHDVNNTVRLGNRPLEKSTLTSPEPAGVPDEDMFPTYQFEQEYDYFESDHENDVKIDPLADTATDTIEPVNDNVVRRSSRQRRHGVRKTIYDIKKEIKGSVIKMKKEDRSKRCHTKKHSKKSRSTKPTSSSKSHSTTSEKSTSVLSNTRKTAKVPKSDCEDEDAKQNKKLKIAKRILTKEEEEIARLQLKSLLEARVQNRTRNNGQISDMSKAGSSSGDYSQNISECKQFQNEETQKPINHVQSNQGQVTDNKLFFSAVRKPIEEGKILKCVCGSGHSSLAGLKQHERRHIFKEPVVCDVCGLSFSKNSLLYVHQNKEHSELHELSLKCNFCEAKYLNRYCLARHIENHHPTTPNSIICDKCGNTFNSMRNLQRHTIRAHKDENLDKELFRCKECGISLKHSDSLRKHMIRMHGNQKTFVCPQCGKITKSMTNMRIHMKVHDPNRTFKRKASDKPSESSKM